MNLYLTCQIQMKDASQELQQRSLCETVELRRTGPPQNCWLEALTEEEKMR